MNLLHLQYFYFVAKEQGYTNASKALRIQQPAISHMVKLLEENLGLKLFEKVGRNVQLTYSGKQVFEYAEKIFGTVEELKKTLGKISGECSGPLHIGASEPVASHYLPAILETFLVRHPKVYPNIHSGPAAMIFESIINGSLEIGIFFHIPDLPRGLEVFETIEIQYYLVVKKDLRKKKEVLERFIGSREIDDYSTKKFPTLERIKRDHPKARIHISSNNLTAHKEMVLRGLGVSILPSFLVTQDLEEGLLVDLYPNETFNFQMKFIKRRNSTFSISAQELLKLCLRK